MLFSLYSPSPVKMTRLKKLTSLIVLACAFALVIVACGGGDDDQASEEPTPAETTQPAPPPAEEPAPTEPAETPPPAEPANTEPGGGEPEPPAEPTELAIADNEVPTPTSVPPGAVAAVGAGTVETSDFDLLIGQREQTAVNQGAEFPAVGTVEYETIKNQLVEFLVQREQFSQEAAALGITVTEEEINARLEELKEQFFEGDEARYLEELENQGLTEEQVVSDLEFQLLTDALFSRVTGTITVDETEVSTYYTENQDSFTTPEQREVAHILVETKEEADEIRKSIDEGEDFAKLAEDNSIDTGTAVNGGAYTAVKGLSVPEFDEVAYALETDEVSDPVETQFGWHIIKAMGDVQPTELQPLEDVRDQIEALLRGDQESAVVEAWLAALEAKYVGKVLFAPGFEPPPSEDAAPSSDAPAEDAPAEESTP